MGYHGTMIASRRRLLLTVSVLAVALVGLMVVQVVLLDHARELKTQAFQRNVRSALALTAQQFDADEIARGAAAVLLEHGDTVGLDLGTVACEDADFTVRLADTLVATADIDTLIAVVDHADSLLHREFVAARLDGLEGAGHTSRSLTLTIESDRRRLISRVVSGIVDGERPPVAERLAAAPLDSILAVQLAAAGIGIRPELAVLGSGDGAPVRLPTDVDAAAIAASPFRTRLFGFDFAPPFYELVLVFPDERAWLLRQMAPLLVASLLFLALVGGGFVYTVRALLEQRRYAAQLVGFVNNMTHEFKTPLSTLTLAAEAIARGADPGDEALQRYTRMIREETARMGLQAERILQVARLESGELELSPAPLDGARLVDDAAAAAALRVTEQGGTLTRAETAGRADLRGDELHLAAVLDNVLDNAVKYSTAAPEITVATAVADGDFVVTVADRGVGVPKADRERVFEPYYRCPTGNRHDVKGHGLGLSYVRLVVATHGGGVRLEPNPGGGTRVILRLPLAGTEGAA